MLTRILLIVLALLISFLPSRCQEDTSSSVYVASGTFPPTLQTEVPSPFTEQFTFSVLQGKPIAIDGNCPQTGGTVL